VASGGEGSGKPVGVAGGNGRDPEVPGGAKGRAVADRFSSGHGADDKDAGFPRENRF
jgi:hypothetical protein